MNQPTPAKLQTLRPHRKSEPMKKPTYPTTFRGGHMTKVAGQAASCAPDNACGMPAAKALAIALMTASPLAMLGSPALAACGEIVSGLGITICTDATTGTQSPSGGAAGFQVLMRPSSTLTTTTGNGFTLNQPNDTYFSMDDATPVITAAEHGVYGRSRNNFDMTITASGSITSDNADAIRMRDSSTGSVTITTGGGVILGADGGIVDQQIGSSYAGNTIITTGAGSITGSTGNGITTSNSNYAHDTVITTGTGTVTGGRDGISATHRGLYGDLTIVANGDVVGQSNHGINVYGASGGDDAVVWLDITTNAGEVRGGQHGIYGKLNAANLIVETGTGAVVGGTDGISAYSETESYARITTSGTVTGTIGNGIRFDRNEQSAAATIVLGDGDVTGGTNGILITGASYGAVDITTGAGDVTGTSDNGISITTARSDGGATISTGTGTVSGDRHGIRVVDYSANSPINITTSGLVQSSTDNAIQVTQMRNRSISGDINITTGTGGVIANYAAFGAAIAVATRRDSNSDVTITVGSGDISANGYYAAGISAFSSGNGSNTGDIIITSTIAESAGEIYGETYGVYAYNRRTGGDILIEIGGDVRTGTSQGTAVWASNDDDSGDITITATGSGTVFGHDSALYAINFGSGDTVITTGDTNLISQTRVGIFANNYEDAKSLTITTGAGKISGGRGIDAISMGGDITITVGTGGIEVERRGINAVQTGTGDVDIVVNGSVRSARNSAIVAGVVGTGSLTRITLNSGADVVAGRGAEAIQNNFGDSIVTVNTGASVSGSISLQDGSDVLTFAGGDFSGVTLFDGGDSASSTDGFVDTLTFAGSSGALDAGTVINWEEINIDSGSVMRFTGDPLAVETLSISDGGVLASAGAFTIGGNLLNNGTISMITGAAGDTLTIAGDFEGSGTVALDVDFTTDTADTLVVEGDVSGGTTALAINDVSSGAYSESDVTVVTVGGITGSDDFALANGSINAGADAYDLELKGTDWVLALIEGLNDTAAVYEAWPSVLLYGFTRLSSLRERMGARENITVGVSRNAWLPEAAKRPVWFQIRGGHLELKNKNSVSEYKFDSNSWGVQAGIDVLNAETGSGQWVIGLNGRIDQVNATVRNPLGNGSINANGYGIGTSATWFGTTGLYVDTQAQVSWISSDISSAGSGDLLEDADTTAYAASIELGKRFLLGNRGTLVPQAQLSWARLESGLFTDNVGNDVEIGASDSMIGRVGLAYEFGSTNAQTGRENQFYVVGNVLRSFSGENEVTVAGTNLNSGFDETWAEIGAGGSFDWDGNKSLFAEGIYRTTLGGDNASGSGLSLTAGFRMKW